MGERVTLPLSALCFAWRASTIPISRHHASVGTAMLSSISCSSSRARSGSSARTRAACAGERRRGWTLRSSGRGVVRSEGVRECGSGREVAGDTNLLGLVHVLRLVDSGGAVHLREELEVPVERGGERWMA